MHVHFLASTLVQGGAETMAVALSRQLSRRGHRVSWTLLRDPGSLGNALAAEGDLVHGFSPRRFSLGAVRRLRDRFRGGDGLYVLDHQNAVVQGGLAAAWAGVPRRLVAVHTTGLWGGQASLGLPFRRALRLFDTVLALSPVHGEYLVEHEGVSPGKVSVVPNGIDLARFARDPSRERIRSGLGLPPDAFVMGMVAMLRPEKNHALFVDVIARLRRSGRDVYGLLVGEGEERAAIETQIQREGLSDRVRLLGQRGDVTEILGVLDLFVLASLPAVETQPVSVLEAMAAGVPVLATRVGDLEAMLEQGESGGLVPPGDADAMTRAMIEFMDDADRRYRVAQRGRIRVRSYSIEAAGEKLEACLKGGAQ